MKTPKLLVVALAAVLLIAGCARQMFMTRYFLLEYQPNAVNPSLKLAKPLPYRLLVSNLKLPRSYDSVRIIARYSSHEISYFRYSLWAVRPQIAVADMLVAHINAYRLFRECQREYLEARPDYEISGEIQQVEAFESEDYNAAHLKMTLTLSDYNTNEVLVAHDCDRELPIPAGQMTIFAKAVSDIVEDEAEKFLGEVVQYFQPPADTTGTGK